MSIDQEEKPTLAERYTSAVNSSHLRQQESRCDVDFLIAAGWLTDGLGAMLFRVRAEFDSVRADIRSSDAPGPVWETSIKAAEQAVHAASDDEKGGAIAELARLREERRCAKLTERARVLVQLKTLAPVREAIGRFAVVLATKIKFMQNDAAVAVLTGRGLDAWLDPICHNCEGRGFNGGRHRGDPKITCRECGGLKLRRDALGRDPEERRFVKALLGEVDQMLAHVEIEMKRYLSDPANAPAAAPALVRDASYAEIEDMGLDAGEPGAYSEKVNLKRRLVDLRSAAAEAD